MAIIRQKFASGHLLTKKATSLGKRRYAKPRRSDAAVLKKSRSLQLAQFFTGHKHLHALPSL
ncbi:Hypothetical protein LCAKO_2582 [Lacticaseibacillus paracasei subsp. paracasei]|uniref:Uncharacterized protein n=1 Tax=Lacticaseibacillus paracasei subsp. paracasei TaxID=47714 RepID=A0AAP9HJ33_LACPA|nr:Hypothetical protein LCAKO_2582 [Lacticaseibacillus paracasei subsp. paracasei]